MRGRGFTHFTPQGNSPRIQVSGNGVINEIRERPTGRVIGKNLSRGDIEIEGLSSKLSLERLEEIVNVSKVLDPV